MGKVILQGYIIVPDNDLAVVTRELVEHIQLTRSEHGCLFFSVTVAEKNKNKFDVYEEFVDQEAFDKHQSRVKKSTWGRVTKAVERHYLMRGC